MVCAAAVLCAQPRGLEERLAIFDAKTSEIADLTAHFEQEKHSVLLRTALVSRGTVRVRGEVIRWEAREPIESVIRVDSHDARIYYPDQKLVEIYELGADLRFLAGSPVARLGALKDRFVIGADDGAGLDERLVGRAGVFVVSLAARDERLASRIERIRLVLDGDGGVMRQFELTDGEGERTVITFTDIRVNVGLGVEDVALDVPDGVRVSRPFGGGEAGSGS